VRPGGLGELFDLREKGLRAAAQLVRRRRVAERRQVDEDVLGGAVRRCLTSRDATAGRWRR
jgi:hypothetical protein